MQCRPTLTPRSRLALSCLNSPRHCGCEATAGKNGSDMGLGMWVRWQDELSNLEGTTGKANSPATTCLICQSIDSLPVNCLFSWSTASAPLPAARTSSACMRSSADAHSTPARRPSNIIVFTPGTFNTERVTRMIDLAKDTKTKRYRKKGNS